MPPRNYFRFNHSTVLILGDHRLGGTSTEKRACANLEDISMPGEMHPTDNS